MGGVVQVDEFVVELHAAQGTVVHLSSSFPQPSIFYCLFLAQNDGWTVMLGEDAAFYIQD